MTASEQDKVAKILRKIQNKDAETLDKLTKVSYSKTQNEVTSYFAKGFNKAEDGIEDGLQYGLTRKFDIDSDDVKVYLKEHEQLKKSVDEFLNGTNTNLRHAYAEYQIPQGTLRIENDKVVGIKIGDEFFDIDSTKFKALDLEDTVEHILDNKASFVNQRYKF
jgi:ribosomal protein S8